MTSGADQIRVIYDGDCPFCANYIGIVRLRENFSVELVDARANPDVAQDFAARGFDLSDGMIVESAGRLYYGAEAIHALSLLSSSSGLMNRLIAFFFRHGWLARALYPSMKLGRRLTLALLGKSAEIATKKV